MENRLHAIVAVLGAVFALSSPLRASAAQEVVKDVPELKSNAAELAAAGDAGRQGARHAGSTTLAGIRLGSLLGEYPECQPGTKAVCWTHVKVDADIDFFGFKNIPRETFGELGQKQEAQALVEVADGRIEKIALRFRAKDAAEAAEMKKEAQALGEAKWGGWKKPARLGKDGESRAIWIGPKELVGTVSEVPSDQLTALVKLSTQDFELRHLRDNN